MSPKFGVLGIDVYDWAPKTVCEAGRTGVRISDGRVCNPASDLGSRLEELRARLSGIRPEPSLQPLIVMPCFTDDEAKAKGLDRAFPPDLLVTRDISPGMGLASYSFPVMRLLMAISSAKFETGFIPTHRSNDFDLL